MHQQNTGTDAMFTPVSTRAASAYKRVSVETGVETADAHQLIGMLYDGALQYLHLARGAMQRADVEAKTAALGKALRIIDEGLKASLNPAGGELSVRLQAVYEYSVKRLTLANLRNDPAAVAEVIGLIEPLAESWKAIRAQALKGA